MKRPRAFSIFFVASTITIYALFGSIHGVNLVPDYEICDFINQYPEITKAPFQNLLWSNSQDFPIPSAPTDTKLFVFSYCYDIIFPKRAQIAEKIDAFRNRYKHIVGISENKKNPATYPFAKIFEENSPWINIKNMAINCSAEGQPNYCSYSLIFTLKPEYLYPIADRLVSLLLTNQTLQQKVTGIKLTMDPTQQWQLALQFKPLKLQFIENNQVNEVVTRILVNAWLDLPIKIIYDAISEDIINTAGSGICPSCSRKINNTMAIAIKPINNANLSYTDDHVFIRGAEYEPASELTNNPTP